MVSPSDHVYSAARKTCGTTSILFCRFGEAWEGAAHDSRWTGRKGAVGTSGEAYQSTHHQVTELNEGCAVSAIVSTLTGRRPMSEMKAWMAGW